MLQPNPLTFYVLRFSAVFYRTLMPKKSSFKLLEKEVRLTSRVFAVRHERWRAADGSTFERDTVTHPGAVAIVPISNDGKVLMIRQFRPAISDWLLEIPAGTLEKGEKPLFCAKREIIEETGFAARNWKPLGKIFPAPGFCSELIHLFKASDLRPAFAEQDEDEHIELAAMSPAELGRALRAGKIHDAKSLSAILHLCLIDATWRKLLGR